MAVASNEEIKRGIEEGVAQTSEAVYSLLRKNENILTPPKTPKNPSRNHRNQDTLYNAFERFVLPFIYGLTGALSYAFLCRFFPR